MTTTVSLIMTVLNEGESIDTLMHSLLTQTQRPDEVVIVDGGSRDDTVARIRAFQDRLNVRVLVADGANISTGRNLAIQHASGDILAITDAGVRLNDDWLERVTQPLHDNPSCTVSAGFFEADPHTLFEVALGASTLPLLDEIDPQTFLPSSRSIAVRREAALEVGGYPEWLDYCEDLVFDFHLKATQPPFAFAPLAIAHFRPRATLVAFFKQYYRYARGDGKANLWYKRHRVRYGAYCVGLPALLSLGAVVHPLFWGILLIGGMAYCWQAFRRVPAVMRRAPRRDMLAWGWVIALIPVLRVAGDIAKMCGYPVGWWWRKKHAPPSIVSKL